MAGLSLIGDGFTWTSTVLRILADTMKAPGEVSRMASVFDVAAYILNQIGPITTMKLQKLVYYSQAWSLVWDDHRLFQEKIEAWANGPVCPALYRAHQGNFRISRRMLVKGDARAVRGDAKDTVDMVLQFYGDKPSQWLSDLTHAEEPWRRARSGLPAGMRSNREITLESMAEYYSSIEP